MGIFASKEPEEKQKPPASRVLLNPANEEALRLLRARQLQMQFVRAHLLNNSQQTLSRQPIIINKRPDRIVIRRNMQLINNLRAALNLPTVSTIQPIRSEELHPFSKEYLEASQCFYRKNERANFQIQSVRKLKNPFIELHYLIAKQKCREKYGEDIQEAYLFHGTKAEYLPGILTYNLDRAKVKNHKFGHGISFARDASYASHYHRDNKNNFSKVMIIAKVFFGQLHYNISDATVVPPSPSYTSCNSNMSVFVKFDDASYYPEYVVHYTGLH